MEAGANVERSSEETIVVCMAVGEMARPVIGSVQRQCASCGCGVLVSPVTQRNMVSMRGSVRLQCGGCAIPVMITGKAELLPPEQNQLDEVREELARRARS